VLFQFASKRRVSLACRMAPRLQLVWKRGSTLAPVVGEGQVNLVATGCSRLREPWSKSPNFVVDLMMNQIDLRLRLRLRH